MNRNKSAEIGRSLRELAKVFARVRRPKEMQRLFEEIFTPPERRDFALRWRLLEQLLAGRPQRQIAAGLGVSLCKITRGAKVLKKRNSLIKRILG